MRSHFAFCREAGGQNDLVDDAIGGARQQHGTADLRQPLAIQRADPPQQHKVEPAKAATALERGLVSGRFNNAQQARVAAGVYAGAANVGFGECMATLAVAHLAHCLGQRTREPHRTVTVMLQQVECHALRRLDTDPWQTAQGVNQRFERGFGHGGSVNCDNRC